MSWSRAIVGALVVLPVVMLFAFGLTRDPRAMPTTLPGRTAPDFELVRMPLDGGATGSDARADTVRLSRHRGDVVVVNFWASWCLPCRTEHAALTDVARAYRDRGVRFYGVLYQDSPSNARRWLDEMGGVSYPILLDPGARTAIDYGLTGVPETVFIGPDGRVSHKQVGPVTSQILVDRIEALLPAEASS